jgi:hypothetical protein
LRPVTIDIAQIYGFTVFYPDSPCWHVSCDAGAAVPELFNMSTSTVSFPFIEATTLQDWMVNAPKVVLLDARFDTAAAAPEALKAVDRRSGVIHVDVNLEAAAEPGPSTGRLALPGITACALKG